MSSSQDDPKTTTQAPSGSADRLEEVLDKLDVNRLPEAFLRTLLTQTMETLKTARRRIDEQKHHISLLKQLSTTDTATGLLNMRGLHLVLRRVLARARRDGSYGALIVIDLDGFKAINDSYGHAAGDSVLGAVARFLSERVRESDEVARLGGDEFAVLMPGVSRREANRRATTLSEGLNGLVVQWEQRAIQVRGSVGGACFGPEDDLDSVYRKADEEMYRRKHDRQSIRVAGSRHDA